MKNTLKELTRGEIAVLLSTLALLAVFFSYLVYHVRDAHREGTFDKRPPISDLFGKPGERLNVPDPQKIEGWMTFKYVNVVFGLGNGVLKNALKIEDPKYPNVPIGKYSRKS